jgi:glucosamine--fructose-6-phosphate aminotransferase (isomerizing)
MCGIVGYIGHREAYSVIIKGLHRLEYRGYDSAGIVLYDGKSLKLSKTKGKVSDLEAKAEKEQTLFGKIGMGHTRWATHGVPNDVNSHPHFSNSGKLVIIHNGIIENYIDLKLMLEGNNYVFHSQTDTEVIVNLLSYNYNQIKNVYHAIKKTVSQLNGTYGLIIQFLYEPNKLFCVRNGSPLLVGQNENSVIVTSEQSGFCNLISNYITLNNDDICVIEKKEDIIIFYE